MTGIFSSEPFKREQILDFFKNLLSFYEVLVLFHLHSLFHLTYTPRAPSRAENRQRFTRTPAPLM
jgi:hypothetical protein